MSPDDLPDPRSLKTEAEIIALRDSLPKVRAGNPLQGYKWALACQLRAVRMRAARELGDATQKQLFAMIAAAPIACPECDQPMRPWINRRFPTIDHVVPVSKGGSNHPSNLRIICNRCNSRKGNR